MDEDVATEEEWQQVATFGLQCPCCAAEVPVGVLCQMGFTDEGQQEIRLQADTAELWAHTFTHDLG